MAQISLPEPLLAQLQIERWNTLTPEEHNALALALTERFHASGVRLVSPRLEHCGPYQEQAILFWYEETTRLDFALIPGGTLLPGYDAAQLERYAHIYQLVEGWRDEADAEEAETAEAYMLTLAADPNVIFVEGEAGEPEPETPERTQIFASKKRCDIRRKPDVPIQPFLMAVTPLLSTTPQIPNVAPHPHWMQDEWTEGDTLIPTWRMRWPQVETMAAYYNVALPTSAEYEWAISGGISRLFSWGDEIPDWVVDPGEDEEDNEENLDNETASLSAVHTGTREGVTTDILFNDVMLRYYQPDRRHTWPYSSRFGLVGMAAWTCWCAPSPDAKDPFPLVLRGGASDCYPWQACGEWKTLLNATEGRISADTNYGDWNALRPVIRLCAEDSV